jgi:hypothetical protein
LTGCPAGVRLKTASSVIENGPLSEIAPLPSWLKLSTISVDVSVRIAISQAAFESIARTLPLGSVAFENKINENGERLIWLELRVVDRLRAMRGRGEDYSQVILRLAAEGSQ